MTTPAAILISALIFAVSGLSLFRWDMQTANDFGRAKAHRQLRRLPVGSVDRLGFQMCYDREHPRTAEMRMIP